MSIGISRRRWLMSAAAATAWVSPSLAETPLTEAKVLIANGAFPVPSRTVRLHATGSDDATRIVVTAIAADPTGELLAVAGDDHEIRIMKASTLSLVKTLPAHRDVIRTLAFDSLGQRLASAGNDGQLILWDCENSFRIVQRMQGTAALTCVRFSASGSELAAVGFDNDVFIIGRSVQPRPVFQCDCKDLRAVAYRDDDRVLAVAGRSGDLHLFDPQSGQLLSEHTLHHGRIHGIAFHRDSDLVVCVGEDGYVSVFDTENEVIRQRIHVTTGKLYAVAVTDSQRVAVAGSDNTIRVVNTDSGQVEANLTGHDGTVATLAASGGMLFSGGFDASLRRWSLGELPQTRQRIAEGDPRIDR